jgi:hypothetical protein
VQPRQWGVRGKRLLVDGRRKVALHGPGNHLHDPTDCDVPAGEIRRQRGILAGGPDLVRSPAHILLDGLEESISAELSGLCESRQGR